MKAKDSLKEEFKNVVYDSCKALGMDDLPSKLIAILQSETKDISLGELAEMTGYSLSALSTIVKGMEEKQMIKRFKKPRSRRVYVTMDNDITSFFIELHKKRYEQSIRLSLDRIPPVIEKYKDKDVNGMELEIINGYYSQVQVIAEETVKYIESLDKRRNFRK